MGKNITMLIIVAALFFLAVGKPMFVVTEREQVVVTQLGEPRKIIREAGFNFKVPFIQKAIKFDDRLLEYDAEPTEILTQDKKNLVVDNYSKWRIVDPLLFLQTVQNERGAQARLDDIIYSELRVQLGLHNLSEIVSDMRADLMQKVTVDSAEKAKRYGIEVVDVRIKRADLPSQTEKAVYNRMRAERERIGKQYRAEGNEKAAEIRAETDKEKAFLLADAYEREQTIRGEGDALSIKIYAEAYNKNRDFYYFTRSLDAYKESLKDKTTLILSPDSEFLRFLINSQPLN